MAFVFADRVKETSTGIGTSTLTLDGAPISFQTFLNGIGNTNQCYYTILHDTDGTWEVGLGTVSGASLVRDTVLASSNGGLLVNFLPGTKTVFVPATAQAFTERLTAAEHALIDHQVGVLGVPAPESFTEADHNDPGFSHAGLPGVPGPETFINTNGEGDHVNTDHTGLTGIPVISAPAPTTYNVNRVSTTTTVDLTATTDGIHYISLNALGTDFDILQVNIPPTPTDDTPFLVIFNEDVDLKGGILAVSNGGPVPLVYLKSRDGCRLWHAGSFSTEWQVEPISPSNGFAAETLLMWSGDSNVADDWFHSGPSWAVNIARDGYLTDWPIPSQIRLVAMSYYATAGGIGDTQLSIDEVSAVGSATLAAGLSVEDSILLDATVTPTESGVAVDSAALGLRYVSGGDKNDVSVYALGISRTGGPHLSFRASSLPLSLSYLYAGASPNPGATPPIRRRYYVMPTASLLDRVSVITSADGEFDLTIVVNDTAVLTLAVTTTADVARLVQFSPVAVPAGARIGFSIDPTGANPNAIHVVSRFRRPRGFFIPFGGANDTAGVFGTANTSYSSAHQVSFVVPTLLRILDWGWIGENMDQNDYFELRRNGSVIFSTQPTGKSSADRWGIDYLGVTVAAGDVLTITTSGGFVGDSLHVIRATADPLVSE